MPIDPTDELPTSASASPSSSPTLGDVSVDEDGIDPVDLDPDAAAAFVAGAPVDGEQPAGASAPADPADPGDPADIDVDEVSVDELSAVLGGALLRDGLMALGDALIGGDDDALAGMVTRGAKALAAIFDNPEVQMLRERSAISDRHDWSVALRTHAEVVELLIKAKVGGLSDEVIRFLLESLLDTQESTLDRLGKAAVPYFGKLAASYGRPAAPPRPCADCQRQPHGWSTAPLASDEEGFQPTAKDLQAFADMYAYAGRPAVAVPSVPVQSAAPVGFSRNHVDLAAMYGTSGITPGAFVPPGAHQAPFQTIIGPHGVGHQPMTVQVEGVGRTVERVPGLDDLPGPLPGITR